MSRSSLRISYWVIPIISGSIWLGTLLTLLLYWILATKSTHYPSMRKAQTIAYISDIGASTLKPLFVAGSILTTVLLDISFACDWFLRRKGRLLPNESSSEKILSALTIFFSLLGTVGLCCLAGFDTARYQRLHIIFLMVFIGGYMLAAVCICWQYQRLGMRYRQEPALRISFWIKLTFCLVEFCLAVAFIVLMLTKRANAAAIMEWVVATVFAFYVVSFSIDLYPAAQTSKRNRRMMMRKEGVDYQEMATGPAL